MTELAVGYVPVLESEALSLQHVGVRVRLYWPGGEQWQGRAYAAPRWALALLSLHGKVKILRGSGPAEFHKWEPAFRACERDPQLAQAVESAWCIDGPLAVRPLVRDYLLP